MGFLIANALNIFLRLIYFVLFARIILSFFLNSGMNEGMYKIYNFTVMLTEPVLAPVRSLIWKVFPSSRNMPIDFSPLVLFLIIDYVISPILSTMILMVFR